jgi:MOSC domain-containing protein YiiM
MTSTIERIYIRATADKTQNEVTSARLVSGEGIEGDRYFGRHDEPGQNVSFVEAEAIESFQAEYGLPHDLSVTGRNLVTRGVRLNDLVGREFMVGAVRFRGVELCEPCMGLGERLHASGLTPADVVKRLLHRAGLRADVLSGGQVAAGASFELLT